ncbi:hypothetical protein SDC9_86253 [bioreactor metagenome]|uniref:Cyclic nucleotide-binding domain-containing protein n=1 Tax=bioreactor metagenome TaxID=1076179 RepID=A0A644ZFP8_9ZZZZ
MKGSFILFPGESNNYLYILVKGTANVMVQSASGINLILHVYDAYSCFGDLELFNKHAKTFVVVCSSDCETIILHKDKVFEWMRNDFEFTKFLIEQLTEKILNTSHKLTSLSLLSVTDRFLYCIYTHYKIGDLGTLTKEMVCTETVIPLRSLNRSIAECKKNELIEFKSKHFRIISLEKFERHCREIM